RPECAPNAEVPGSYRRLATDRAHAEAQAGRGQGRAGRGRARLAQTKAAAGRIRLVSLDECGFAPSQPVSYTWVRKHERKRVPDENPEGRRVNALAALVTGGDTPALSWVATPGSLRAHHLIAFLRELPAAPVPTIVVLDDGPTHRSKETRAAL